MMLAIEEQLIPCVCARGCPQIGSPRELGDQLLGDLLDRGRVAGHPRLPRRGVVQGPAAAKQRDLRLQCVDLVDRAHQGKHEVGIVNSVGHRLREGQADLPG